MGPSRSGRESVGWERGTRERNYEIEREREREGGREREREIGKEKEREKEKVREKRNYVVEHASGKSTGVKESGNGQGVSSLA